MPTDIAIAYDAIRAKRREYDKLWRYYDGDHPLVYSASRLDKIFRNIDASFSENWAAVVVDSVLERLQIDRFTIANNEAAGERLARLWLDTELTLDAYDAHLCALVTGESAVIAGQDEFGELEAYYNDSRMIHVQYESARPNVQRFAAKLWNDKEIEVWRMTLYYPDRWEYWVSPKKTAPEQATAFVREDTAANPFGQINVFHLLRERRKITSELANIIRPQAQLNKLLADMMIASEFGAFPQRYVISQVDSQTPLKNLPGLVWDIPAADGVGQGTQVGQLQAAELGNYIQSIDRAANVIAAISRTPKHYFFQSGDVPSGEALQAMESPLVKKVQRYASRFEPVWRRLSAFLLALDGGGQFESNDIDIVWAEAATKLPLTEAQTVQAYVTAGMPLKTALRQQGWADTELEQLDEDRDAEQATAATMADALMSQAQRNFDRGNGQNGN